jgi:trimethylamine:corrinoid methyltransferase-like protein
MSKPGISFLSQDELKAIHNASLQVLGKTGIKSLGELAHQKVKEILATHEPTPLPEDVDREISRILQRAETEFVF